MDSSEGYSVVIIDSDPDAIGAMTTFIKDLGDHAVVEGAATTFEGGFELVHKKKPKVVILECGEEMETAIKRIRMVVERFPEVLVFATCPDKSSDTILKLMRAGATEYLLKPVNEMDLSSALQKHGRLWVVKPPADEAASGRILSVYSPKGGVGATSIALNIATNLYDVTKRSTLLVDLDLNAGDVTTFLNIKPSYTISDVTVNMSRLDKTFLKGVITRHESGIHILAEPQKVQEGVSISSGDVKKVIGLLKNMFSYVVLDCETSLDGRTQVAIEMSDMVLVPFVLSLPGIKNMQRYLKYFGEMGYGRDRVKLVVNRYEKKGDIRIEDAEKALNYPVFWALPNDYDSSMACLNKGVPLSICAPRSKVSTSIKDMAKELIKLAGKGV